MENANLQELDKKSETRGLSSVARIKQSPLVNGGRIRTVDDDDGEYLSASQEAVSYLSYIQETSV